MRFRRREVVFDKVETRIKRPRMLQKLMKNEDRAPGKVGLEVLVAPTPSPEATNFQVVMGEGVDEGLCLESAPLGFSEAAVGFAILIYYLIKVM